MERNIQQATRSSKVKVILSRLEHWLSLAAEIEVVERPTTRPCTGHVGNGFLACEPDGGVEFQVTMQMRPGHAIKTVLTDKEYLIPIAPWETDS